MHCNMVKFSYWREILTVFSMLMEQISFCWLKWAFQLKQKMRQKTVVWAIYHLFKVGFIYSCTFPRRDVFLTGPCPFSPGSALSPLCSGRLIAALFNQLIRARSLKTGRKVQMGHLRRANASVCEGQQTYSPPRLGGCLKYDLNNTHEFPFFVTAHRALSLVSKKNLC